MSASPALPAEPAVLRVAAIIDSTRRLAYAVLDAGLIVGRVSRNFSELTGCPEGELAGRPLTDLLGEFVGAEQVLAEIARGQRRTFRLEHVNRPLDDGSLAYVTYEAWPLSDLESGSGVLLIAEDTTDYGRLHQLLVQERNELRLLRRQLAAANHDLQHLNRLKSLFLSMAAHDLRTPLAAIRGFAELLQYDLPADAAESREFVDIIVLQADRLQHLITDLLDLDQIEQGRLALRHELCALSDIIGGVIEMMRSLVTGRRQQLTVRLGEGDLFLWADPERLAQIVYNLIGNAVKYTPEGGAIRVEAWQENDVVAFRVADNGPGISEEQLANLFTLYYRTPEALQKQVTGTGLGLFIVKSLVEAHHGSIEVESRPDQGSVFTVRLPGVKS